MSINSGQPSNRLPKITTNSPLGQSRTSATCPAAPRMRVVEPPEVDTQAREPEVVDVTVPPATDIGALGLVFEPQDGA
ncbi:hypothetical protein BKA62DRAFT_775062 [Auriculariales sp. MPI-PUGE-AT-0066]|nr:hypothetical protein BKA62DRAFT_775062 [Auriculariales sp. MPI-PUGE-AT-0066]